MTESGGLPEVQHESTVSFSKFTIDLHKGEYSTCQLLPSTLTFSDVLIGIDLVGGKT